MFEIQHNTIKKMPNNYVYLLCDCDIKVKKDPVDTIEMAKKHLSSAQFCVLSANIILFQRNFLKYNLKYLNSNLKTL